MEVHSERYHSSRTSRHAEAARVAALREAGFTVVVVWDHEVWGDPDSVLARVLQARSGLGTSAA
ncbi:MAG: DUF559 domain-containing protein [Acidimicrobiia bacterium]|nr:DUF559 domain-containing protein [Acidimicrobiia bacterium]